MGTIVTSNVFDPVALGPATLQPCSPCRRMQPPTPVPHATAFPHASSQPATTRGVLDAATTCNRIPTCLPACSLRLQVALDTATHAVLAARQPVATSRRMSIGPQAPAQ